jgi:hypothetical protein
MSPENYFDKHTYGLIPELYFQYKFPDIGVKSIVRAIPAGYCLDINTFKDLILQYLGVDLHTAPYIYEVIGREQHHIIQEDEANKIILNYRISVPNKKSQELHKEKDESKWLVSMSDFTEVSNLQIICPPTTSRSFKFGSDSRYREFLSELHKHCKKPITEDDCVYTLGSGKGGPKLDKHFLSLTTYGEDIVTDNYNDDFQEVYNVILEFLKEDEKSGLVILDGKQGTGKTSLIKHFISVCSEFKKRIVIVPAAFAGVLSEPGFLSFASNSLKDTVLLLEDAETALASRTGSSNNPAVSNILNLSSGILGDILSSKIIATVNTVSDIDPALQREGRLVAQYSFNELREDKAKKLASKLGVNPAEINGDTILASIYNRAPNKFMKDTTKSIGFRSN